MADEQAAAVERLRNKNTQGWQYRFGPPVVDDLRVVADLYLAEHRADDCESVTEDWLRSVGAVHDEHPIKWTFQRKDAMDIGLWHVYDGWKAMLLHTEHWSSCIVRGIKTRGDVRRLCAALNIPLTEQETAT